MAAEYITADEAAVIRGVTRQIIYTHAVNGRIRSKKDGPRSRLVLKSDVLNFKKRSGRPRKLKK